MKRPLNSDELGEKGELRFAELCISARLVCNRVQRDRTGWDFVVEFPFSPPMPLQPLDSRQQPPECRVQVKTVWEGQRYVSLRLSAAERLAKLLQPAFVCVLEFDGALQLKRIHVIHILGDALEHILREVRLCQATDSTRINKEFIRIKFAESGISVECSGNVLRDHLAEMSGEDRLSYINRKADQIKNLGAVPNRYSGRMTIQWENEAELVDVMLGLKSGNLKAFSASETRWGITLPIIDAPIDATMHVEPKPMDGELTIRDTVSGESVRIEVGVIFPGPPGMFTGTSQKARITSQRLEVIVGADDSVGLTATVKCDVNEPMPLSELILVNKIQRIMSSDTGTLELRHRRRKVFDTPFGGGTNPESRDNLEFARDVLSALSTMIDKAGGTASSIRMSLSDINAQVGAIQSIHDLMTHPSSVKLDDVKITTTREFPKDLHTLEMLAIGRIVLTSHGIGFCAIGECTTDGDEKTKTVHVLSLALREIALLGLGEDDFAEFTREMQATTGLTLVLRWEGRPSITRSS
jgi:hypothetical protein